LRADDAATVSWPFATAGLLGRLVVRL